MIKLISVQLQFSFVFTRKHNQQERGTGLSALMLQNKREYGKNKVLRDLFSTSPLSKTKKSLRHVFRKQDLEPRKVIEDTLKNLKNLKGLVALVDKDKGLVDVKEDLVKKEHAAAFKDLVKKPTKEEIGGPQRIKEELYI